MQNQNTKINFLVGLFVLGGIVALLFLALQAANLSSFSTSKGYEVTAYFDNIGGLKARAPVRSAGVLVGRVKSISYDNDTFQASSDFYGEPIQVPGRYLCEDSYGRPNR